MNPPGLDCGAGSPARRVPGRRVPVRRINAGAAAGLLLAMLVGAPACAVRTWSFSPRPIAPEVQEAASGSESGWAAVETIVAGVEIDVHLRAAAPPDSGNDEAPTRLALRPLRRQAAPLPDGEIVKGRFLAATADTLTVTLPDGCRQRLARQAVHRVRVRRPFWSRPPGWIAFGVGTAFVLRWLLPLEDLSAGAVPLILSYTSFPASLPFFFVSPMKTVYTAPPATPGHGAIDLSAARTCD